MRRAWFTCATAPAAVCFAIAAVGLLASDARSETDCLGDDRPSCTTPNQRRCECQPNCRYFGTCCADAKFSNDSGAGEAQPLPKRTFRCEPYRYGGMPVYAISRCPQGASSVPRRLADLCETTLQENHYLDARFWPVSGGKRQLVYESAYCALCHGETLRNMTRWTASLVCPNGTNVTNRDQLIRRCNVHFDGPPGFSAPRCWKDFVDVCELPPEAVAVAPGEAVTVSTVDAAAARACRDEQQATVWWGGTPFRNRRCAECSGVQPSQLACSDFKSGKVQPEGSAIDVSFRVLLDPGGPPPGSGCSVAAAAAALQLCGGLEYYDHWLCTCQPLCPPGFVQLADGSCQEMPTTPTPSLWTPPYFNSTSAKPPSAPRRPPLRPDNCFWTSYEFATSVLNVSDPALSDVISHAVSNATRDRPGSGHRDDLLYVTPSDAARAAIKLLPIATAAVCARCHWYTLPADSAAGDPSTGVLWKAMGRSFRRPLVRQSSLATIVCIDPDEAEALRLAASISHDDGGCGPALDALGVALMVASLVCLAVHAVAFFLVSSLRNMPGKVVFSQVVALLLSYVLFLSRVAAVDDARSCYAVAVILHYFLLAYFAWTLVLAIEIHGAVRALKRVYSDARQFVAYSLVGWLSPLVLVVAALLTDRYGSATADAYRPGYGGSQCWMGNTHGYRIFFTAPMCAIVLADVVLYSAIVVRIVVITRRTAHVRDTLREKAVLSVKLLFALGVLWLFAVAGTASGNVVVLCLFSNVLNTSQGVIIFAVFFCANKRVLEMLRCVQLEKFRSRISRGTSSLMSSLGGRGTARRSKPSRSDEGASRVEITASGDDVASATGATATGANVLVVTGPSRSL